MYLSNIKRRPLTHRKSRIRKKYRIGEFTEYGFDVTAMFVDGTTEDAFDRVLCGLIEQIERRKLCCGGGCDSKEIHLFVSPTRRCTTATQADCTAIHDWLLNQPDVSNVDTGPLVDAWSDKADYS